MMVGRDRRARGEYSLGAFFCFDEFGADGTRQTR